MKRMSHCLTRAQTPPSQPSELMVSLGRHGVVFQNFMSAISNGLLKNNSDALDILLVRPEFFSSPRARCPSSSRRRHRGLNSGNFPRTACRPEHQALTAGLNTSKICSPAWGKHPSAETPALYLREGLAGPPRHQRRGLTHHTGAGAGCTQAENEQRRCHTSIIIGLMTPWHDSLAIYKYTHIHIYNM